MERGHRSADLASGLQLEESGSRKVAHPEAAKGPFGYAGSFGYQEDADSSLKLLGHRYYDASTGRFLSRDPAKDGRNWYVYSNNSAVARIDPEGLKWAVSISFTAALGIGISGEVGLEFGEDGVRFTGSGGIVAGVALKGRVGPKLTVPLRPGDGPAEPPGWLPIFPGNKTELTAGPVGVEFPGTLDGPINGTIQPGSGVGMTMDLIGFKYNSGPLPIGGEPGGNDWRWPTPEDWWRNLVRPAPMAIPL